MPKLTHDELVNRACRWLHSRWKCSLVSCEPQYLALTEQPDVIGWAFSADLPFPSHLVEVKTCVSDFNNDFSKPGRRDPTKGMGQFRWYFAEKGILPHHRIPDGWGLAEVCGAVVRILKESKRRTAPTEYGQQQEHAILLKICDRAGVNTFREFWHRQNQGLRGEGI